VAVIIIVVQLIVIIIVVGIIIIVRLVIVIVIVIVVRLVIVVVVLGIIIVVIFGIVVTLRFIVIAGFAVRGLCPRLRGLGFVDQRLEEFAAIVILVQRVLARGIQRLARHRNTA